MLLDAPKVAFWIMVIKLKHFLGIKVYFKILCFIITEMKLFKCFFLKARTCFAELRKVIYY